MGEDNDKIIRIPGENLNIKVTTEEEEYRQKYLPDLKRLTDEKLVCTVCSVSLAQNIHKGKDIYIHRALQVLVCEPCYNFYGDGCFSADEDGDDKYCRWCGQGGTLYLCSKCNCAFCQKCIRQNLKPSVLKDLDNDDWKCYICNPRPLFGCRTICWGAQQLNEIGKEKERERLKKQRERLEKIEAKKREANERKSLKDVSSSEDEAPRKKKRRHSDSDSLSPEVMPKKRPKRESSSRNLNGSIGRRKQKASSSDSEEEKQITRRSKLPNKKGKKEDTSSDDSDHKSKKGKLKKNKKKESSDESTDDDYDKKKSKRKSLKTKSCDEESTDEKSKKKKQSSKKKKDDTSDTSSDEKHKKKNLKKKKHSSSEESSIERKKKNRKKLKKKGGSSEDNSSDDEAEVETKKRLKNKRNKEVDSFKKERITDSDTEMRKSNKIDTEIDESKISSADDILMKKRIKLAIMWLSSTIKDISELGTLISVRASKFCNKKINTDCLKTYDDVLITVNKLRQLLSGIHSNYEHIEKTLDSHLKPWKALTGLDEPDSEKNIGGENCTVAAVQSSRLEDTSGKDDNINLDKNSQNPKVNIINPKEPEDNKEECQVITDENQENKGKEDATEGSLQWSDETDEENNETKSLISKASKVLDKSQDDDQLCENLSKSPMKKDDVSKKDKNAKLDSEIEESVSHENDSRDNTTFQKEIDDSDIEAKIKTSKVSPAKSKPPILEESLPEKDTGKELKKSTPKKERTNDESKEGSDSDATHEETGLKG